MKVQGMNKYLIALLLMAGAANAQEAAEQMGYASIGTAFKLVTDTTVAITSGTTAVATATSSTIKAITWRTVCNVDAHINPTTASTTTPAVTTSNTLLPAYVPEYFVIGRQTNTSFRAANASGTCWLSKTGR